MAATNDITGDSIQTGVVTDAYRNNYDQIFKKNLDPRVIQDQMNEDEAFRLIRVLNEHPPVSNTEQSF